MPRKLSRIAQSTAEYAIIIAIVVGAVIAMQVFVKRGIQGRVKDAVDWRHGLNAEVFPADLKQYEPDYSESNMDVQSNAQRREVMTAGGAVDKNIVGKEVSTRKGTQKTLAP